MDIQLLIVFSGIGKGLYAFNSNGYLMVKTDGVFNTIPILFTGGD